MPWGGGAWLEAAGGSWPAATPAATPPAVAEVAVVRGAPADGGREWALLNCCRAALVDGDLVEGVLSDEVLFCCTGDPLLAKLKTWPAAVVAIFRSALNMLPM